MQGHYIHLISLYIFYLGRNVGSCLRPAKATLTLNSERSPFFGEPRFSSNVRLHVRKLKTINKEKGEYFHAKYSKQAFYRFCLR